MKTKFYKIPLISLAIIFSLVTGAQTPLKMGSSGGPGGNGPSISSQGVTLFQNGTTAFTPAITVSYSLSNQQFAAGTLEGISSKPAMNFGGNLNSSSNSALGAQSFYNKMNAFGSPLNSMFASCSSCGTSSMNVSSDRAISLFNATEAFINAGTGANTQALNARIYVGDITITFNKPVSNPVLHFVGLGGTLNITKSGKNYDLGFSTEFDLISSSLTLSKLSGNNYLSVSNNAITNSATWFGASSQGSSNNGVTRYAASGSVMAAGTNITSVSFKVYLRGDGGRVNNGSSVVSADAGLNPLWAVGSTNAFGLAGNVSGDLVLIGTSLVKPVTVSGNVFNDPDGGFVNNSTGTSNVIPAGIYASLIDTDGKLVSQVAVSTNGTYNFPAIFAGTYTVNTSITTGTQGAVAPAASVTYGWVVTGEYNGAANTGNDGNGNGISEPFTVSATNITNINFGIERPPLAPTQSYTIAQPVYNSIVTLNGSGLTASPAPLTGIDPEEGNLGAGRTFSITTGAAMNGNKLYYNGIEITGTISIANYNPSLLTVKFSGAGSVELMFNYQSYDAAGKASNSAVYHIQWISLLPVRVFEVTVSVNNAKATINWKTENEVNTSRFYAERSTDNRSFTAIANTAAAGNSLHAENYSVQDDISNITGTVIYYRIKLVDVDGKITYSNTVVVRIAGIDAVKVFPNPFVENINVAYYSTVNTTTVIKLVDMSGKTVAQTTNKTIKGSNQVTVANLKNIAGGIYLLQVADAANNSYFVQKLTK